MRPSGSTRRALLLLGPILVAGIVAGLWSISSRGDAAFVFNQSHPRSASNRELERLVRQPRQPTAEGPGKPGRSARCTPGSSSGQRNPWDCTVRYEGGDRIRYRVKVDSDGSYVGADRKTGAFIIRGCCTGSLGGG